MSPSTRGQQAMGYQEVPQVPPEGSLEFRDGPPATLRTGPPARFHAPRSSAYPQIYPDGGSPSEDAPVAGVPAGAALWVPPQPHPDMPIKGPRVAPVPGQVLLYYEVSEPDVGFCKCEDLSILGVLSVIVLLVCFWPLAWLPCVITECHRRAQRPVYGFPPADEEVVPTLVPGAAVSFPHHQMMYFPNQQV